MLKTKKSMRFLTVFILFFAMVFSVATVPISAAGVETWYTTSDYIIEPSFTNRGYNLTPIKTMGASGTLHLVIGAHEFLDASTNPVNFKYEIRSASGSVLKTETIVLTRDSLSFAFWTQISVTKGQQIQLYTSTYDAVTGNYRTVKVEYWHWLS